MSGPWEQTTWIFRFQDFLFGKERDLRFDISSYNVANRTQLGMPGVPSSLRSKPYPRGCGFRPDHVHRQQPAPVPVRLALHLLTTHHNFFMFFLPARSALPALRACYISHGLK